MILTLFTVQNYGICNLPAKKKHWIKTGSFLHTIATYLWRLIVCFNIVLLTEQASIAVSVWNSYFKGYEYIKLFS